MSKNKKDCSGAVDEQLISLLLVTLLIAALLQQMFAMLVTSKATVHKSDSSETHTVECRPVPAARGVCDWFCLFTVIIFTPLN